MTIEDLRKKRGLPFQIEDEKVRNLFSFFLHAAPTIDSASAADIPALRLEQNWARYIDSWNEKKRKYKFYSSNSKFPDSNILRNYNLNDDTALNRQTSAFICFRKEKNPVETDYECILRQIRNSIAHNNVFICNAGNRKYILFEDQNNAGNKRAILLLSQTELEQLKKTIIQ